jgi:hypothetical protein
MPANNAFFDYLNKGKAGDSDVSARLGNIEKALGITTDEAANPATSFFGTSQTKTTEGTEKKSGGSYGFRSALKQLKALGKYPVTEIKESENLITESAPDYAQYLAGQIGRGQKSPEEAADLFSAFSAAYNVPGGFKTAEGLGSMSMGQAPAGTVERYRPYQEFAAKALGLNLSEEDVKSTEAVARALNKTTPEAFSQLLGQKMLSSPEYIRKTPLAFAANLPYGGKYGVGYQTPEGTFTGTYRFKPPSTVDYS